MYAIKFFGLFIVLMPVIVPFFEAVGLGMKGVYLIQASFAITVFIAEIPSGYLSDMLGRKYSLLLGSLLFGIGFSIFPFAESLWTFILAEIILGIGASLKSGTDTSIIYDTLESLGSKKAQIKILGKSMSYLTLGEGLASIIASILMYFAFTTKDLAAVSAFMSWIPFALCFFIIEPPRQKMESNHRENFKYIFKRLFKETRLLNLIILNTVLSSCATLMAVWLFQKYWNNIGIPLVYFGLLWGLNNLVASFFMRKAHKIEKIWGSANVIIFVGLVPIAGYLGISLIDHMIGYAACLIFQVGRGVGQVIFRDALNKRVSSDFRATANSVAQMGTRVLFSVLGPALGLLIDVKGLSIASLAMAIFYGLIFIIAVRALLKERENFIKFKGV